MSHEAALGVDGTFAFPSLKVDNHDLSQSGVMAEIVRDLVRRSHVGLLTTVDGEGRPQARWMASLSADEFPWFYALTAEDSRKVEQIERQPAVNWLFSNADLSMTVNFSGRARIVRDVVSVKRIWKLVHNKEHAYFLRHHLAGLGFVVIATRIETVECCVPRSAKTYTLGAEDFKGGGS